MTSVDGEGIVAKNYGPGSLTVTTTGGTVSSTDSYGIFARNGLNSTSLTINAAGDVTTANLAIEAKNSGSGPLSITSTGTVTSTENTGIYGYNKSGVNATTHQALSIYAGNSTLPGNVSGFGDGVFALNRGNGTLMVTTYGAVTGSSGAGIRVRTMPGTIAPPSP